MNINYTLVHFNDSHKITEYDNSFSLSDIKHEIEANGYDWVTMHNINGHVLITIIEK